MRTLCLREFGIQYRWLRYALWFYAFYSKAPAFSYGGSRQLSPDQDDAGEGLQLINKPSARLGGLPIWVSGGAFH